MSYASDWPQLFSCSMATGIDRPNIDISPAQVSEKTGQPLLSYKSVDGVGQGLDEPEVIMKMDNRNSVPDRLHLIIGF